MTKMLELPHALVGAAIATAVSNPALALPLALASHFATDYVPHWNPHINTEIKTRGKISLSSKIILVADSFGALIIGSTIAARALPDIKHAVVILLACFLAVLPDVIEIPYYFLGLKRIHLLNRLINFQRSHQWNVPKVWGILSQIIVCLIALRIIF